MQPCRKDTLFPARESISSRSRDFNSSAISSAKSSKDPASSKCCRAKSSLGTELGMSPEKLLEDPQGFIGVELAEGKGVGRGVLVLSLLLFRWHVEEGSMTEDWGVGLLVHAQRAHQAQRSDHLTEV